MVVSWPRFPYSFRTGSIGVVQGFVFMALRTGFEPVLQPLTVAHQTGTSLAMIEKAYLRFIPVALREKLAAVKE